MIRRTPGITIAPGSRSPPDRGKQRDAGKHIRVAYAMLVAGAIASFSGSARADNFLGARYDAAQDELVVSIDYGGTHPNHAFSLHWGTCHRPEDGKTPFIDAEIIDQEGTDAATHNYTTTARFSLEAMPCRPAAVTLRTPPGFFTIVRISAKR